MAKNKKSQNSKIGELGYLNKNCWLVKSLNYAPYKRCQYCQSEFRYCRFLHYQIISLVFIIIFSIISFFIESNISILFIISVFALIVVYGYFFNKSTDSIIKANFTQQIAKEALQELNEKLEEKVDKQVKDIKAKAANLQKLLDEISHKNIQLNKLLNMRSKFLDTASHQLRTPVSIMKGVMEMVTSGEIDKVSPERRKMLMDGVYLKTKKLENIITDILDATEMDTEKFTLSKSLTQKVQLEELINNIVISHQLDAETKKIELIYHKPKDSLPTILGSQKHLDQVFSNLVDNAIKYTPSKNQAMGEKGRVLISLSKDDNNVIVSVSDNGIGIPGKEIKNLFEKFSRATNAKEMYTDGTGLGLFIAKEIIIGHHGKITVTSEINKGTTFKVYLPVLK